MHDGHEKTLLAAQGYCELGMFEDALAELNTLPDDAQQDSNALELRLAILMQARRWKSALTLSRELCRLAPAKNVGYIHAAFCLHELGKTGQARDLLLSGPETLHKEPAYHYNLACYECRLGNHDLARAHLDRSIQLDKKFREFARTDPDLQALRT
jgi:predicted Zn-dependent protease